MEEISKPSASQLNNRKVLLESNRIIKSQPRNFLFLALLFLLPPSIASVVFLMFQYPLIYDVISNYYLNIITNTSSPDQEHISKSKTLILLPLITYALFILFFYLCAVGSVTYTTFHGFHGQTIKLKSALMSITTSFFPLLGTTLLVQTILYTIVIIFAVVLFSLIACVRSLGFQIEVLSPYFLAFCVAIAILFMLVVVYLYVNWALVSVIVVVESTWGFKSLKRSASLIKGRRGILLFLSYIIESTSALLLWVNSIWSLSMRLDSVTSTDDWKHLFFILANLVLMTSTSLTLFQLLGIASKTVLYVHCKAIHDGEESPGECIGLLSAEDEKVVCVV